MSHCKLSCRFIQRLKHTRQSFSARKVSRAAGVCEGVQDPIPTLPSTYSIHDFHNFSFQGTGISPGEQAGYIEVPKANGNGI